MNSPLAFGSTVTLCLTIGKRPDLLKRTLDSLLGLCRFSHIIAINDFRDEDTNEMFRSLCPQGQLICLDRQMGHHKAVDFMYSLINTPYVLHCEDDWLFDVSIDLERATHLLDSDHHISQICFRKIDDFNLSETDRSKVFEVPDAVQPYFRMDSLHNQWHGYTFNPHLANLDLWKSLGGFYKFDKERHISRHLRSQSRFTAYMNPGCCVHIGELQSVSPSALNPKGLNLARKKIKSFFGIK